jgi:hypothetical protein
MSVMHGSAVIAIAVKSLTAEENQDIARNIMLQFIDCIQDALLHIIRGFILFLFLFYRTIAHFYWVDPYLNQYDTIIIDEAHERSLNIDFLLGYMRWLLPRRPDLKLIITSATIDPERFSEHFFNAPIINVSGRTYPVEMSVKFQQHSWLIQSAVYPP